MMESNYSAVDFHSHFLPNMDDGSSSAEESLRMLQASYWQGVDTMVATPHFYAERSSIAHFLSRRNDSCAGLQKAIGKLDDIPHIFLGAEVLYFQGISRARMLPLLCIEQTNILLLEMPFAQWDESMLREIEQLQEGQHLQVVIAHLDRYFLYQKNPYYINRLLEMPVGIQLNADAFFGFRRYGALKLVKSGHVDALGSDCHNMTDRMPNMRTATKVIEKKLGAQYLEQIDGKCRRMLTAAGHTRQRKEARTCAGA
jgi:protein-tyrosine phosphatase